MLFIFDIHLDKAIFLFLLHHGYGTREGDQVREATKFGIELTQAWYLDQQGTGTPDLSHFVLKNRNNQ